MTLVVDYYPTRTFESSRRLFFSFAIFIFIAGFVPIASLLFLMHTSSRAPLSRPLPLPELFLLLFSSLWTTGCGCLLLSRRARFRIAIGSELVVARFPLRRRTIQWSDIRRLEFCRPWSLFHKKDLFTVNVFAPHQIRVGIHFLTKADRLAVESALRAALPPALLHER